jgi:GntR family transcriptional repressor for pyruvate dehydrogenase complex
MISRPQRLAPINPSEPQSNAIRSPKAAELVANALRSMIVDGQLKDGDFLPTETELMNHFEVSRPTMREAVRVLESDQLVEVRRGSRTGARVRVPGPEIVARPAGLLLELSGATLADVITARIGIEPLAVKILAEAGTAQAHEELVAIANDIPAAWKAGRLAAASSQLHRRVVELSGNATLGLMAGMLHEISERHTRSAIRHRTVSKPQYDKMIKSYGRLVDLVTARDGRLAEAHWRRHMETSADLLLKGYEKTQVRDVFV